MVWFLNDHWDLQHRSYAMSVKQQELAPLKLRAHGVNLGWMRYDERYTPYVRETGLLPFIQLPREPEVEGKKKERVAAGATFTWIVSNFSNCPEDANEDTVKTYARVYMWYVISRSMFADGTGKNAPWMWLKALTVFDSKWSWGSATLAYLYRQLDEACCRLSGGIGGCLLALSIWSWERLPVGRSKTVKLEDWDEKDDPLRLPTWAYKWDVLNDMTDDPSVMYKLYRSEMDAITPEQFGLFMPHPPEFEDTDIVLHNNYLTWFLGVTRVEVCKPAYDDKILEEPTVFDEVAQHQYNTLVRKGNSVIPAGPMMNFVVPDDMTLGTYKVRSAYDLKPRKGINKYTPEDFTQRGKRTVGTSRMAALDDYLDDDVDDDVDDMEEPEPEPERVRLPRKVKKIPSKRGGGASKRGRN
ncbi:uncharacterized protein LOC119350772 [Triticum dicoccoides]|uniref:uncharacterized protein LOC119350772 n=1 Tax=Triticum dicoccoides TaxID=85692 RepID=UPI0018907FF1|nr:uncharacterized protein LOC119350772 [Triticum dicoccoides]